MTPGAQPRLDDPMAPVKPSLLYVMLSAPSKLVTLPRFRANCTPRSQAKFARVTGRALSDSSTPLLVNDAPFATVNEAPVSDALTGSVFTMTSFARLL